MFHCECCVSTPTKSAVQASGSKPKQSSATCDGLFEIVKLRPDIKVCRGKCDVQFQYPCNPPYDLVARRFEKYSYYKDGKCRDGEGWRYYHLKKECMPNDITQLPFRSMSETVKRDLGLCHRLHLQEIGIKLPNL